MAQAGFAVKVYVRDVVTAPVDPTHLVDGINKITYNNKRDLLDTTDFKDTSAGAAAAVRSRLAALKDLEVTISGDYEFSDTVQGYLRTAIANGTSVWLSYYPNPGGAAGSKGFKTEMLVENESQDVSGDGKVTVSYSLKATAASVVDP